MIPDPGAAARRHATGAETARALLFTVLGELALPAGGTGWTSAFIDVLTRLGVEEKTTRQALMRTAAADWLTPERLGRRTRWHLTAAGHRLLTEGAARIYGFPTRPTEWDGRWVLLLARVPETDRRARHFLRTRLAWSGFGTPTPGVWISPHTDHLDEAKKVLAEAGLLTDSRIFVAEYQAGGDLATMAAQAWDLTALDDSYRDFITEFSPTATTDPTDPTTRVIELVHAWRRFPWLDPALPPPLLPTKWSGGQAAEVFAERRSQWTDAATEEWARLNRDEG